MGLVQVLDVFVISGVIAYLMTPFIRVVAIRTGYIDHPQNNKVHAHPTPLLGGISIFMAFVIAILTKRSLFTFDPVKAMLLGSSLLLIVGLIDDKMGMMPNIKLLGQFLAALIMIKGGVRIMFIDDYYLSIIITYVWIIGITNSINLLDNMNGLSAGIAGIAALSFGFIAYINGQVWLSVVCCALAGSAFGFLKHNFPKATIFMGDSGSLVLGYILSVIAIMSSWEKHTTAALIAIPLIVLGYPIFDTILVSVMRTIEKRSIFQGGKDHSSHRLALLGFKKFRTVLVVYVICICLGIIGVTMTRSDWCLNILLISVAFIFMLALGIRLSLVDTKRFGRKKIVDEE